MLEGTFGFLFPISARIWNLEESCRGLFIRDIHIQKFRQADFIVLEKFHNKQVDINVLNILQTLQTDKFDINFPMCRRFL